MRLVTAAAALVAFLAAPAIGQNAPLALQPGETLLEVEAEGVSLSHPDIMTISAGVATTGSTATEALSANSEIANRIIAAVRGRNIDARDVRTTQMRVSPRFSEEDSRRRDGSEPRIIGYIAQNRVDLRLRDLSRASELLDALLSAGANDVDGPSFSLSNPRPARLAAQRDAVRLAREEAEAYAAALGMQVMRVLRVSERSRYIPHGEDNTIVVRGSRVIAPPIEPGELETAVTVWVDFALSPQ